MRGRSWWLHPSSDTRFLTSTCARIATPFVLPQVVLVLDDEALQAELNEVRPDAVEVTESARAHSYFHAA